MIIKKMITKRRFIKLRKRERILRVGIKGISIGEVEELIYMDKFL